MRLGIVRVKHQYVADLDDPTAIKRAREFLKSDLCQMAVHPDNEVNLDRAIGVVKAGDPHRPRGTGDFTDNEDDLINTQLEFTKDPVAWLKNDLSFIPRGEELWLDPGDHLVSTDAAIEMERMWLLRDSILQGG
jgi:hypothetical protein